MHILSGAGINNVSYISLTFIRPHYFVEKKVVVKEVCGVCHARIGFRKIHYKCRDCAISSHIERR